MLCIPVADSIGKPTLQTPPRHLPRLDPGILREQHGGPDLRLTSGSQGGSVNGGKGRVIRPNKAIRMRLPC
jgi:hypothetical protein